jgi:hypothetical protein
MLALPDRKTEMDTFAIITVDPNELLAEKTGHDSNAAHCGAKRLAAITHCIPSQSRLHPVRPLRALLR